MSGPCGLRPTRAPPPAVPGPVLESLDGTPADPSARSCSEEACAPDTEVQRIEEEYGTSAEHEEEELHTGLGPGKDAPVPTRLYIGSEPYVSTSCSREDGHECNLVKEFPGPCSVFALVHRRCVDTPGDPTLSPPAAGPLSSSQVSPSTHQLA